MLRKKRKKLKKDFEVIFQSLTPEEQLDLASTLMTESYLGDPHRFNKAMMDIEVSRIAKRVAELKEANEQASVILSGFPRMGEN